MKGFSKRFVANMVGLAVLMLCLTGVTANLSAQSTLYGSGVTAPLGTLTFHQADNATILLNPYLANLNLQIKQDPKSSNIQELELKYNFALHVWEDITIGFATEDALIQRYSLLSSNSSAGSVDANGVMNPKTGQFYNAAFEEVVNLLKK